MYALLTFGGGEELAENVSEGADVLLAPLREDILVYDDTLAHMGGETGGQGGGVDEEESERTTEEGLADGDDNVGSISSNGDRGDNIHSRPTRNDGSNVSSGNAPGSGGSDSENIGMAAETGGQAEASEEVTETYEATTQVFEATAYTAYCEGCSGVTYSGVDVRNTEHFEGKRVIAVDPDVIPLGSDVIVTLADGRSFEATAQDIGSAIQGGRIDILVSSRDKALEFGRQAVEVTIQ